jgi:hypothetical protein
MMDPSIKVTRLKKGLYGIRCYSPSGNLFMETTVKSKIEISPACRDLLRWWDKSGGSSVYASKSRHRLTLKGNKNVL